MMPFMVPYTDLILNDLNDLNVSGAILPVRVRHMCCDSARPDSEGCSLLCSCLDGQTTL